MKKLIIISALAFLFFACEKEADPRQVKYLITDSVSGFSVTYTDESGEKQAPTFIPAQSEEDIWTMRFTAEPGQILYLSVLDTVPESFTRIQIYVDGKIYKQAIRDNDPTKPAVVSGVVPF
jgi:hypothetical protein